MRKIVSLFTALAIAVTGFLQVPAISYAADESVIEFYVSPEGSDLNRGTKEQPFQTLERARDAVYEIKQDQSKDIVVYLREGTYALDRTFELSYDDSGENGHKIIYQAYPGETPVITGGKPLDTDWQIDNENLNIYKTFVGKNQSVRDLYVNGKHAQRARSESRPDGFGYNGSYAALKNKNFSQ